MAGLPVRCFRTFLAPYSIVTIQNTVRGVTGAFHNYGESQSFGIFPDFVKIPNTSLEHVRSGLHSNEATMYKTTVHVLRSAVCVARRKASLAHVRD